MPSSGGNTFQYMARPLRKSDLWNLETFASNRSKTWQATQQRCCRALALYQTDNNIWHSISGLWDFKIFNGKRVRAMLNHVSRILFYAFYLISWECGWLSLTSWMVPGLLESSTSSASLWATWSCWTSPIWWRYLRMRGTQCLFLPQHYCL